MSQISGSRLNPVRSSMLRPSSLQSANTTKVGVLRPPVININSAETDIDASAESSSATLTISTSPFILNANANTDEDTDTAVPLPATLTSMDPEKDEKKEKPETMSLLTKNGIQKSNLFATTKTSIALNENGGFVFGQNIHERVTGDCLQNVEVQQKTETEDSNESGSSGSKLFAIAGTTNSTDCTAADKPSVEASVENLTEVARVYEESRARKRKYDEVETFTGEEEETNVLDVNCKLFAFVASNWEERGPGSLRVNDAKDKTKRSRVVFRTSGNLRVLLNTKIWPGMVVERPSLKSLRLTAIDSAGHIKIFLAMARPDDIRNLNAALNKRVEIEKNRIISDDDENNDNDANDNNDYIQEPCRKKTALSVEVNETETDKPNEDNVNNC